MITKNVSIDLPIPYVRNPRKNDIAIDYVASSIKEFGFQQPIVVDKDNIIIAGHTRFLAAKKLNLKEVPIHIAEGLTPQQVKAYRIADNKTAEYSEFDNELLVLELDELKEANYDLANTGFDSEELDLLLETESNVVEHCVLSNKFGAPPFSILNVGVGYWQDRKRQWSGRIQSEKGRKAELQCAHKTAGYDTSLPYMCQSTSVFDPVLCELMYKWFCPPGGNILDPFAGGSVRGIVGSMLGYNYTGIDLSEEQITENIKQWNAVNTISNNTITIINWIIGDSRNILKLANNKYDFIFSCPPYYDLEVYSNDKRDISTLSYDKFIIDYGKIIKDSMSMLKDNRFACFVVGEVRDKKTGIYRSFVADTINAFKSAGMSYYNEIILATPTGTAHLLANRQFSIGRKVVKIHQNVLVFIKGDSKKAIQDIGDIDMSMLDEETK